jgi:hypothetical protein
VRWQSGEVAGGGVVWLLLLYDFCLYMVIKNLCNALPQRCKGRKFSLVFPGVLHVFTVKILRSVFMVVLLFGHGNQSGNNGYEQVTAVVNDVCV